MLPRFIKSSEILQSHFRRVEIRVRGDTIASPRKGRNEESWPTSSRQRHTITATGTDYSTQNSSRSRTLGLQVAAQLNWQNLFSKNNPAIIRKKQSGSVRFHPRVHIWETQLRRGNSFQLPVFDESSRGLHANRRGAPSARQYADGSACGAPRSKIHQS